MCCFFVSLVYSLFAPIRVNAAFAAFNFPWLVGILGLVFIPWTSLMFVLIFPLNGWDWIWLGLGVAADIASFVGGYHKRQQIPGYPSNDPLLNY